MMLVPSPTAKSRLPTRRLLPRYPADRHKLAEKISPIGLCLSVSRLSLCRDKRFAPAGRRALIPHLA